jgi:hypothetical protein
LCVQVLWLGDCLAIWRSVYYLGHISIIAIMLVGVALPPRKPKREVQPEKAATVAATGAVAAVEGGAGAAQAAAAGGDAAAGSLEGKTAQ